MNVQPLRLAGPLSDVEDGYYASDTGIVMRLDKAYLLKKNINQLLGARYNDTKRIKNTESHAEFRSAMRDDLKNLRGIVDKLSIVEEKRAYPGARNNNPSILLRRKLSGQNTPVPPDENSKYKYVTVADIILITFCGWLGEDYKHMHKDSNFENNHLSNLGWFLRKNASLWSIMNEYEQSLYYPKLNTLKTKEDRDKLNESVFAEFAANVSQFTLNPEERKKFFEKKFKI